MKEVLRICRSLVGDNQALDAIESLLTLLNRENLTHPELKLLRNDLIVKKWQFVDFKNHNSTYDENHWNFSKFIMAANGSLLDLLDKIEIYCDVIESMDIFPGWKRDFLRRYGNKY